MLLLITLPGVVVLSLLLAQFKLKKTAWILYTLALGFNIVTTVITLRMTPQEVVGNTFLNICSRGLIGMSFLLIIMYIGALNPKNRLVRSLMTIRGELSILGVIFMMNHFIYYIVAISKTIPNWSEMKPNALFTYLMVSVLSIWAWIICIPLFITSFRVVRKKMNAKEWKRLQRLAYLFYGLVYVHIMFSFFTKPDPFVFWREILVYSVLFFLYTVLRIWKALEKKKVALAWRSLVPVTAILIFVGAGFYLNHVHEKQVAFLQAQEIQREKERELARLEAEARRQAAQEAAESDEEVEYMFKDGTYQGSARGYNDTVTISLTLNKDIITDIHFEKNNDDQQYVNMAKRVMEDIQIKGDTDVDVVTGATVTSIAIIKAADEALTQAAALQEGGSENK